MDATVEGVARQTDVESCSLERAKSKASCFSVNVMSKNKLFHDKLTRPCILTVKSVKGVVTEFKGRSSRSMMFSVRHLQ